MIRRTGSYGQTPERILRIMASGVSNPDVYLLIGLDDVGVIVGFLLAVCMRDTTPWIEVVGLWTKPGIATALRSEGHDMLCQWARTRGAKKIFSAITRSYDLFFKFFHEPLGYKKIGIIVEFDLEKDSQQEVVK